MSFCSTLKPKQFEERVQGNGDQLWWVSSPPEVQRARIQAPIQPVIALKRAEFRQQIQLWEFAGMQRAGLNRFAKVTSSMAQLVADLGGQGGYRTSYGHFLNGCINSGIQISQHLVQTVEIASRANVGAYSFPSPPVGFSVSCRWRLVAVMEGCGARLSAPQHLEALTPR